MTKLTLKEFTNGHDNYVWSHGVSDGPIKAAMDKIFDVFHSKLVPEALAESELSLGEGQGGDILIKLVSIDTGLAEFFLADASLIEMAKEKADDLFENGGGQSDIDRMKQLRDGFKSVSDIFDHAMKDLAAEIATEEAAT